VKPRVLYIDHTIYKSGAAISLGTLIRSLSCKIEPYFILRKGSEVEEIIGATGHPIYFERWMPQFMTPVSVPQYSPLLFLWHVAKLPVAFINLFTVVKKWKIDLLHLNETTLIPYVFFGWLLRKPVVMHARCTLAQRPIERFFLRLAASLPRVAMVAIDEETKWSLPEKCRKITRVIYNPIDLGPEPSLEAVKAAREAWGCSQQDILIGQVASLHTSKGIWEILEIAAELCPLYPNVRFVLVGDDRAEVGEGPRLRRAIQERNLTGRVILVGYRPELSLVYGSLDIALCLFGGNLGGVGRAAFEAALAGKPLIATLPDPDSSESVKNGVTGLVFEPADKKGMHAGLQMLIQSRAKREEVGERAKRKIGERHSPPRIAAEVEALYASLLG